MFWVMWSHRVMQNPSFPLPAVAAITCGRLRLPVG
jgi:hypothetical protein